MINQATHINRIIGLADGNRFGEVYLKAYPLETEAALPQAIKDLAVGMEISPEPMYCVALGMACDVAYHYTIGHSFTARQLGTRINTVVLNRQKNIKSDFGEAFAKRFSLTEPRPSDALVGRWLCENGYKIPSSRLIALMAFVDLVRMRFSAG